MLKRLTGVFIVIALFLPAVGLLIGVSLAQQWMTEVNTLADIRLQTINTQLSEIDTTITNAGRRVEEAQASLAGVQTTIDDAQEVVSRLIGTITVPDIVLPTITMTIPIINADVDIDLPTIEGFVIEAPVVNDVRQASSDALVAAEGLTTAVDDVTALGRIPGDLREIVNEASQFTTDLRELSTLRIDQIRPVLLCGLVWLIGFYLALIWRWLRGAWQMITATG